MCGEEHTNSFCYLLEGIMYYLHKVAMSIIMAKIYDSKRYNSGTAGKRYTYVKEVTHNFQVLSVSLLA